MIENKKILILGMARSGIAAAKLLADYHNEIVITDLKEQDDKIVKELEDLNIKVVITDKQELLVDTSFDMVVKNPAINKNNPSVQKAKSLNIPVINELEVSYHFLPSNLEIIGITGSNGKTTTTTMIYELLKRSGQNVYLAGNIGTPLASIVKEIKENSLLVLEISDHQLCDMDTFKTNISVLTNLSQVHLDFHDNSYTQYKNTKKKIFNNHTKHDIAILNKEDQDVLELTQDIPSSKLYFSSKQPADAYLENDNIICYDEKIISTKDITVKGIHNYENIMVAILIAKKYGVSNEIIKTFFQEFKGVEHRIEFVRELKERKFYNDSKATNNKSTIIALSSFNNPTILLMGGLDRNIPFDEIAPYLTHVKTIICFGQTKEKIALFAKQNNKDAIVMDNLVDATKKAYEISRPNDVILLSPACASWDQYPDFETRGQEFKEVVNNLK